MQIKTITTVTGVNEIDFGNDGSQSTAHFYWLKNLGDSTLYVSANPNPIAEKDDVAELPAKGAVSVETDEGKIYILGAGKVEIHRTNSKFCPFDWQSSGSGGGGGESITVDSELSDTSTNPLQNKVTTAAIKEVNSAVETKSDINHIHDISASGNPVIMDNLQGGVPFSEMIVSGKNLLTYPYNGTTKTVNGITFTDNGDGSIAVQGTATARSVFWFKHSVDNFVLPKNTPIYISAAKEQIPNVNIGYGRVNGTTWVSANTFPITGAVVTFDYENFDRIDLNITVDPGSAVDVTLYPQIELGDTATAYEPPITGRGLTVNASGKNLLNVYIPTKREYVVNNTTFTINDDGSVSAISTETEKTATRLSLSMTCPPGDYMFSGSTHNGFTTYIYNSTKNTVTAWANPNPVPCHIDKENEYTLYFMVGANCKANGDICKPQLEIGSVATEYEPYHGSATTITPTSNPYTIPDDITQQEGYNVISVSEGELSVVGVQKNAAIKRIWDDVKTLLGDISQFLVGRSKGLSDLIELWVGLGELSDPRCYRLIPVLSSNVGTNGVASCNTEATFGTNETAYQAFDNNIATFLAYSGENVSGGWVMYEFISPVCVSKMSASVGIGLAGNSFDFHFEYYDDVSKMWVIFGDEMNVSGLTESAVKNFEMISDIVTTTKVRIISNTEKVARTNWEVYEFQVYGYMSE